MILRLYFELNKACARNHVVIHNEIGPEDDLDIVCAGDHSDSIRSHMLKYEEPFFDLDFNDNLWPSKTGWNCVLKYGPNHKFVASFEAYHSSHKRCGQLLSWIAKVDGIWFTKKYVHPPGLVLQWDITY
ncbi:unnamed protein product [Thlaspi arvense]|uniref:S-protein homolog n=1 Tax=Thlaspi arvense TaxID=13288 RepID=A0AAU9R8P7_THLAR|nr:unnamed protein product [Thlaspi arvense]